MKKGVSYWSFKDGFGANAAKYEEVFAQAKKLGFNGVEACIDVEGELTFDTPESRCREIAQLAKEAGVAISSVASGVFWGVPPTSEKESERKEALDLLKKLLERAAWLGTDAVLFVPGAVAPAFIPGSEPVRYDIALERAAQCVNGALPAAEKHGVAICIENVWNNMLFSPAEMISFIDGFNSPLVKSYLDLSNTLLCGFPQHWIELLGRERIGRIHTKDFKWKPMFLGDEKGDDVNLLSEIRKIAGGSFWAGCYTFCDIGEGSTDWKAVRAALSAIRYDGWITAEMIPPLDPKTGEYDEGILVRTSSAMDRIIFNRT